MPEKYNSLVGLLDAWFGGAFTTLIGAAVGRFMWHAQEVKKWRPGCSSVPVSTGLKAAGCGGALHKWFGAKVG